VILGIEDLIRTRAGEARVFLETVAVCTRRIVARSRSDNSADGKQVLSDAHIVLERARAGADNAFIAVDRASVQAIAQVTGAVRDAIEDVRTVALGTTMRLRKGISLLQESVHGEARASLKQAAALTEREMQATLTTARLDARRARADVAARMGELGGLARRTVQQAGAGAEALLREVSGQGPERTLKRGFALVRGPKGKPLTRASDGVAGDRIEIVLGDGSLHARVEADTKGAGPAKPVK
jgi:exodeoxyribonuclease VII large subunit